jgi:hypothetical protein
MHATWLKFVQKLRLFSSYNELKSSDIPREQTLSLICECCVGLQIR